MRAIYIRVVCIEAHTGLEEDANMTPENRQVAWANGKVDELANTGAIQNDTEVAERMAKYALDTRKKVCAAIPYGATFHDEG